MLRYAVAVLLALELGTSASNLFAGELRFSLAHGTQNLQSSAGRRRVFGNHSLSDRRRAHPAEPLHPGAGRRARLQVESFRKRPPHRFPTAAQRSFFRRHAFHLRRRRLHHAAVDGPGPALAHRRLFSFRARSGGSQLQRVELAMVRFPGPVAALAAQFDQVAILSSALAQKRSRRAWARLPWANTSPAHTYCSAAIRTTGSTTPTAAGCPISIPSASTSSRIANWSCFVSAAASSIS